MFKNIIVAALVIFSASIARAYSADGHETVGAIADHLLNSESPAIYKKVKRLLGSMDGQPVTLQNAAIWPDCARSYYRSAEGDILKKENDRYSAADCEFFAGEQGDASLKAYVGNNYDNCVYSGKNAECHKSFHFADVPIGFGEYHDNIVGASNHDIAHAINACITVLRGDTAAAPFNTLTRRQALFLLTHLVGDIHQPLHVGAVYLTEKGTVDADPQPSVVEDEGTVGGNAISVGPTNLHHKWDTTSFLTHADKIDGLVAASAEILHAGSEKNTPIDQLASAWASEAIKAADDAYQDLEFGPKDDKSWPSEGGGKDYTKKMHAIQQHEVQLAGARLTLLLQELFK